MIAAARQARDEGMAVAQVADEERGSWDTKVIDQAIKAFADTGSSFSANDIWPLLPEVRGALIGARFAAAATRGYIRKVGRVPSTKKRTHAKDVGVWIISSAQTDAASAAPCGPAPKLLDRIMLDSIDVQVKCLCGAAIEIKDAVDFGHTSMECEDCGRTVGVDVDVRATVGSGA